MRNKTDNFIFSSSGLFKPYSCIRMYVIRVVFCAIFLSICPIRTSHSDIWIDDFDEEVLNGWERIVEALPYNVEWRLFKDNPGWLPVDEGYLSGLVAKPHAEHVVAADFLHWNAHPFRLEKLTVIGKDISYALHDPKVSGELGLFLGKRLPDPDFAEGYLFSPEKTTEMQFSAKGVFKSGEVKAEYGLMIRLTSDNIKVIFDTGKFQLFTQDLLITEFLDDDIAEIDVVGLIVVFEFPGVWFSGSISTFTLSGSGIPQYYILNDQARDVQLRDMQSTTTWGKLKRF